MDRWILLLERFIKRSCFSKEVIINMDKDAIFIKKGDQKREISRPGRLYRLMVKSNNMEAIIAELNPHAVSRWYKHDGEELHLVLEGEMEYEVGEKSYKLSEGDILWHRSTLKHRAKNIGDEKVKYITIGSPPTFMVNEL